MLISKNKVMITYHTGNIFDSNVQAIVNTVNTDGVMGKGIALQFKNNFPNNFKAYQKACKEGEVRVGKMFVYEDENLIVGNKIIVNFPTKTTWKKPSEYQYIQEGLDDLIKVIQEKNIKSIAIPPLGTGNGGLNWEKVKAIIEDKLQNLNIDIHIYEPSNQIKEIMKKERVKLTDARALMLYALYNLVREGEFVSEFSSEKICYFLQRFGAEKYFKLKFTPHFYGPYSGKVRRVLYTLNGSYIMGYSDMNKKPFEILDLMGDGYEEVVSYVQKNEELLEIAQKTSQFLEGFYSDYALELLSSVDYIMETEKTQDKMVIMEKLSQWSQRKKEMFSEEKYIDIVLKHLLEKPV